MMPTFEKASPMPVSAATLAAYHEQPGALDRLVPPWERVRVLEREGDCYEGRVLLKMDAGPFNTEWEAKHSGGKRGEFFVDTQQRGPFASFQHTHRFEPEGQLSTLRDSIEWQAPLGGLGAWVGQVQDRLERGFTFRHRRTAEDLRRHAMGPGPMRILVSGASGLVGSHLIPFLTVGGHEVVQLVRSKPGPNRVVWDPAKGVLDPTALGNIDAVIHLSGESVSKRWTAARKAEIIASRELSTGLIAKTIAAMPHKPLVFISASAVGWYGNRGTEPLTEASSIGPSGFLPEVCKRWEDATGPAVAAGIRTVNLRIGVVLAHRGGALAELLPPVLAGVAGVVGSGEQMFPWIALDDLVHVIHFALGNDVSGPLNATAPTPVSNAVFMHTLGRVVRRPTILPLPAFAVRALFGQMGQEVLLEGQHALPAKLEAAGFNFAFPELESALRWELGA